MKKNLLSVLILVLLIVNLAMSLIIMVSVIGTNSKTGALVRNIATAMSLELHEPGEEGASSIPLSQTATYPLAERMMIQLKPDAEGKSALILFNVSLAMDMEHEDYEAMGSAEKLAGLEIQIRDAVESVVKQYTKEECQLNFESIRAEVLKAVQELFQSDFIYKVSISDVMYQ